MTQQNLTVDQALNQIIELHDAGKLRQSLKLSRRAATAFANVALVHNVHAVVASACNQHEEAVNACRIAIQLEPGMADAHFNLGNALGQTGKPGEAAKSFQAALRLNPGDRDAMFNLALALQKTAQHPEAINLFKYLLDKEPNKYELLIGLAQSLAKTGNRYRATELAEQARSLQPTQEAPYVLLLSLLQRDQDESRLQATLEQAKTHLTPDNPYVVLAQARSSFNKQNHEDTIKILENSSVPDDMEATHQAARTFLLGKAHDKIGNIEDAVAAFEQANKFAQLSTHASRVDKTIYVDRLKNLTTLFTPQWVSTWTDPANLPAHPNLIFLIGFPRSGTTLLDTILRSHSKIEVFEETLAVRRASNKLMEMTGDDLSNLARLTNDQLSTLRQTYLDELASHAGDLKSETLLVDKLPLNLTQAGLIHRLFPQARFLLALRHPCDCVLSCFMQDFWLNSAMANYTTLEDAARLYDQAFSLWQQYRSLLPLNVHELRYEDLVASFDDTLTPLLSFLGVEWEDSMRDYTATAKKREHINTPSYNQVVQPIYKTSSGRWQRYEKHMKPVLPILLPWAKKHGYSTNDMS